jgi:hypothetical protein
MAANCNTLGCPSLDLACNTQTGECEACVEGDANSICRNGTVCNAGTCECPENTNLCGDVCVAQSAASCTAACTACPGVLDGDPTCVNNVCSAQCDDANHVVYKNRCVPGGATCGETAPLGGSCDVVFQTGCNAESEICSTLLRVAGSCTAQADCAAGQVCSEINGNLRCIYFESGCSSALAAIPVCSVDGDCAADMTCTNGLCGPCSEDTDCPTNQQCLNNVCRGLYNATLQLNESCGGSPNRCEGGLQCSAGICKRICETMTGAGCDAGQFCRPLQTGSGAGLCESSCG